MSIVFSRLGKFSISFAIATCSYIFALKQAGEPPDPQLFWYAVSILILFGVTVPLGYLMMTAIQQYLKHE